MIRLFRRLFRRRPHTLAARLLAIHIGATTARTGR